MATKSRMKIQRLEKRTLLDRKLYIDRERKWRRKTVAFSPPTDCYSSIILSPFLSAVVAVVATALGESRDHCSIQERKIHNLHI